MKNYFYEAAVLRQSSKSCANLSSCGIDIFVWVFFFSLYERIPLSIEAVLACLLCDSVRRKIQFIHNFQENVKRRVRHTCNLFSNADLTLKVLLNMRLSHLNIWHSI